MNNQNLSAATIAKYCHCSHSEPVKPEPVHHGPRNLKHPEFAGADRKAYGKFYMRWYRRFTNKGRRRPIQFYEFKDGMSIVSIAKKHNLAMLEVETIIRKFMR